MTLKKLSLVALLVGVVSVNVSRMDAQTFAYGIHNTTLSAAVTATTSTFTVASVTAIAGSSFGNVVAGWNYYVDREFGTVTAVSGTTLTVRRPVSAGNAAAAHASGARIFLAPANAFKTTDPNYTSSTSVDCTQQPIPWINTTNGNIWVCRFGTSGQWSVTNALPITYNSVAPGLPF